MSAVIYLDRKNWVPVDVINQPGVFKTDVEIGCVEQDEVEVLFANTAEYIDAHRTTFNSLQSGEVHNGYVTLYITKEPDCTMALAFVKVPKQEDVEQPQEEVVEEASEPVQEEETTEEVSE